MTLLAPKDGVTVLNEAYLKSLVSLQDFALIYEGTKIDSKEGSGVIENNVSDYYFAILLTATGVTEISRVELEIAADGEGQDITVEIWDGDITDPEAEIALLKTVTAPKEFLPASAAYWSVPIDLSGLTHTNYWLVVRKVGDATNHFHLIGEANQDGAHPCYRSVSGTAFWMATNAIHYRLFSGDTGKVVASNECGAGWTWVEWAGDLISRYRLYLPGPNGDPGIRQTVDVSYSGDKIKRGVIT